MGMTGAKGSTASSRQFREPLEFSRTV